MKKFQFSLSRVQQYKEQMLNHLKTEHGALTVQVAQQENLIRSLEQRYGELNAELNAKNAAGITALELVNYQTYLKTLFYQIKGEEVKLEALRKKEEEKRLEMVEMKKETASLETLKEKKETEYMDLVKKADEAFIDEFVSNQRTMRR